MNYGIIFGLIGLLYLMLQMALYDFNDLWKTIKVDVYKTMLDETYWFLDEPPFNFYDAF